MLFFLFCLRFPEVLPLIEFLIEPFSTAEPAAKVVPLLVKLPLGAGMCQRGRGRADPQQPSQNGGDKRTDSWRRIG